MATPCPHCGTTKTESVWHGFIYNACWRMGYHLRRCSYCNRWRIFKRLDRGRPHPNDMGPEDLARSFQRHVLQASGQTAAIAARYGTGAAGMLDEVLVPQDASAPVVAQDGASVATGALEDSPVPIAPPTPAPTGARFGASVATETLGHTLVAVTPPVPVPIAIHFGASVGSGKSDDAPAPVVPPASPPATPVQAVDEMEERGYCPKCGSITYRRSRRRWYERMIRRERMARCLKCRHRFPYPY